MSRILPTINRRFENMPAWTRRNRFILWGLFILLTVIAAAGMGRVKLDNSVDAFFQQDEPVKQAYDRFRTVFGSDEVLYIVYRAKDGDVFSESSLRAVKRVQDQLFEGMAVDPEGGPAPLNRITDVDTIINVSFLEGREGVLISRDFIGTRIPSKLRQRQCGASRVPTSQASCSALLC